MLPLVGQKLFEAVRSLDLLCLGYFVSNQSDSKTGF